MGREAPLGGCLEEAPGDGRRHALPHRVRPVLGKVTGAWRAQLNGIVLIPLPIVSLRCEHIWSNVIAIQTCLVFY